MATQAEQLAELQSLNAQLGLPGDDGMPSTYDQKVQELRSLDEQLASTPESFGEYVERRKVEDARSLGDKSSAFLDSFMVGGKALAQEGASAIGELFSGDVGTDELGGVYEVGKTDFVRFAKTIGGSIMDNIYSDEDEMRREYQRYKDNFLYNQEVRPAMLNTYEEEGRDFVSFGANFIDPTLLVPGAGLIARGGALGAKAVSTGAKLVSKGAKAGAFAARSPRLVQLSRAMANTSRGADMVAKGGIKVASGLDKVSKVASIPSELFAKGTRGVLKGAAKAGQVAAGAIGRAGYITSKVAGAPRNLITKVASSAVDPKVAGSGILGAQLVGSMSGAVPGLGLLTATEALGYIANKTGRGMERTLSALASSGSQKRFLQRLATSADSKLVRKSALLAHRYGGTWLGDTAFNMLANSATVGTLNAALAYAAGEGPEGVGAAAGSGAFIGGALPFGQRGMRGGKTQKARDEKSISNYLDAKLEQEQRKQFVKLSPVAKLAFATVEEAGIKAPKIEFLDGKTYLELLRQNDPNLRSAPDADLDMDSNVITVNQDGNFAKSSEFAMEILLHELGHGFIKQAIKDDPFFASKILKEYQPKKGEESFEFAFTSDSAGSPIDSIQVNTKAKQIAEMYDGIQSGIGIGRDANALAQEIGAEQFGMMMVDNGGNIFKTIEPSLRHKLLESTRKVLGVLGLVDQQTGNPLSISILGKGIEAKNPILQRSKSVRNLYKNYVLQKEKALVNKIDLAENPMSLKLDKGENAQQAVQRLFSSKGLSLKEAGAFRIKNRQIKRKLIEIRNRLFEKPEGEMRAETNEKGKPVYIVGKKLSDELKAIFTRNDPFGNINTLINTATEAIMQKAQMTMLYRAGKPSKYSDNELRPRVIAPVRYKVTGLANSAKSFASLKLDAFDEAYLRNNAEVLVAEGLAKDPNKLVELARQVARDAMNDPEGRINPDGKYENEIVTALFGQTESAPQIRNPLIRRLLEEGRLKDSYRTYDIDGLAGLVPTGKSGISFDWYNVRNNYLPHDQNLYMPRQSKNFDKKVALRTNDSLIELVDKIAKEEGVSRNDVLNRILQEKFNPEQVENPEGSTAPVDSENVPPITEQDSQNLPKEKPKKYWSEGSDPSLNWLQNDPKKKLFMPSADNVSLRRAAKQGRQLKELQNQDKNIALKARKEWEEMGQESSFFQEFISDDEDYGSPAFAKKSGGKWKAVELYHVGKIGSDANVYDGTIEGVGTRKAMEIRNQTEWTAYTNHVYFKDRKTALAEQKKLNPKQKPLTVATNVKQPFRLGSQSDLDAVGLPIEKITVEDLVQAGFDAYETDSVVQVFDPNKVKLIADQNKERKFLSKDRAFGKVSGLFGHKLPSSRMKSTTKEMGNDLRFMPQMELNFGDGKSKPSSPAEQPSQGISFWKLFGIDKNDKQVYKKVAEKLINTGSPDMDPQTALDYGPRLGMDVERLRQEMVKAQRRDSSSGNKYFMPNDGDYMHKSGGIILPDGSFIKKEVEHNIDLFDWVENNPKNPFAQKMKKAEKFHDERYGEEEGFYVLEAALNAGAIRVARDSPNSKNIYIQSGREIPSRLRRELIDQAMMTGNTLIQDRGWREQIIFQPENKLFMPTETFEGSPGSYFRPKSSRDTSAQVRTFKSPVYLKDGSRLSGVADNPEQSPFYGFDKNGREFSQGREYINPKDITKSRDSDRTANQIRNELESGQKLFMPASEAGAGKGKVAEAAKLWNEKGTDSPYFKKWFGKSKVVDENGEPLVVYHGTTKREAFTEFKRQDPSNENSPHIWNELGLAFFSDSPEVANKYTFERSFNSNSDKKQTGRILPIYLQVKNPKKISYDALGTLESKGEIMRIKQAFEDQGHDGFMLDRGNGFDYVPFSPEQIKSATGNRGTFDAGERNILFMPAGGDKLTATHNLSAEALAKADELGGLPVPSVGITKGRALEGFGEVTLLGTRPLVDPELGVPAFGSDVYSARFPREKYKSVKMKKADEFVAKYRPFANETGGHELSLIFDALVNHPDLGDAKHRFMTSEFAKMAFLKDKGKPVRVPKRKERVDGIVDQQLVDEVNALGGSVRSSSTPEYKLYSEYLRKAFDRREKVISKFTSDKERNQRLRNKELENLFDENGLARIGVGDRLLYDIDRFNNLVVDKSKLRDRIEKKFTKKMKADYEKWATQEIASLFDDPYIVVDGRKVPLSLDTATDAMKGRIRAVEKNMTFGPGEARSMGSSKISSIQMMRNMSDSIVPKEKFETYKETIQEPIHEAFRDSAMDAYKYSDSWASLDLSYRALGQYLQSFKGSNKQRMRSALRQNDFIPNDALIEKAIKAAEVLRDAPTEYFEAKPQRAVKLEEFAGAIIPKKASPKIKELADKYGWEVKTYDPNKPETRQTAVKQLANRLQKQGKEVLFMPADSKAPKAQPANRIQQQAPSMPGNRFMAPAASAGAKLSERFR